MKYRHSLAGKLVILFVFVAVLFVVLVGGAIGHAFREHFADGVQPHLMNYLAYIRQDLGNPPNRQKAEALARKLNIEITLIADNGGWSTHGLDFDPGKIDSRHRFVENGITYRYGEIGNREILLSDLGDATLVFRVPRTHRDEGAKAVIPLAALLLILLLLYHATRRLFRPIETIQDGVRRFGAGDLDQRIQVKRRDELGDLAASFNTMAADIKQLLEAKRQLLLALSHELRTPLTRAKVAMALVGDDTQKAELEQDLNEMEKLIEELLETERLATTHRVLNRQTVSLASLAREVIRDHFDGQAIALQTDGSVTLSLDVTRIRLLLKNLLENALRHTPDDAHAPRLSIASGESEVVLTVQDYGEGIDAQHLAYLTEPFYRADGSRQRETGGYGLGLYLCRMIAEAHDGRITISSQKGEGSTVTVTLPQTDLTK